MRFLRKRDSRYKDYMDKQQQSYQSKGSGTSTPLPKISTNTVPATTFVEQEWQKVSVSYDDNDAGQWDDAEGGEEWECVACGRSFRSEAAWMSHERSRKHIKEVERYSWFSIDYVGFNLSPIGFNGK